MFERNTIYFRQDPGGGGGGGGQPSGGQQPAGGQQQAAATGGGQPQAEAWRAHLPESLRDKPIDEVARAYGEAHKQLGSLNNDLGTYKKTIEQLTPYQQAVQQWNEWWKGIEPDWKDVEEYLRTKRSGGKGTPQPQTDATAGLDPNLFQNWHTLDPQQQARTLLETLTGQLQNTFGGYKTELQQFLENKEKAFQAALQKQQQDTQNYLNVWQRVWEAKQKNPSLDTTKMIEEAMAIVSGKRDPLDLGMQLTTADQDRQTWLAE